MTDSDITNQSQLARRARQYWDADGIPTLFGAGLYLAAVASLLVVAVLLRHGHDPNIPWYIRDMVAVPLTFAMIVSPVAIIFALIWVATNWEWWIEQIKLRITYPRTGYVAPPSRWRSNVPNELPVRRGPLCRLLDFLGGFWFWLIVLLLWDRTFLGSWSHTTVHGWMLGTLIAIRSLRFGLYPERTGESYGAPLDSCLSIWRFLNSVTNSFWVWLLVFRLAPTTRESNTMARIGAAAAVLAALWLAGFFVLLIRAVESLFEKVGIGLCAPLCAFLIWQNTFATVAVALLLPGIYAAGVGAFRLIRYIRANPVAAA